MTASGPRAQLVERLRIVADVIGGKAEWEPIPAGDLSDTLREAAAALERVEEPNAPDCRRCGHPVTDHVFRFEGPLPHCSATGCDCEGYVERVEEPGSAEFRDWRAAAERKTFALVTAESERDEARQGLEYALACIGEWQEKHDAAKEALRDVTNAYGAALVERDAAREALKVLASLPVGLHSDTATVAVLRNEIAARCRLARQALAAGAPQKTQIPETMNLLRYGVEVAPQEGDCGCGYEDVPDGSVTRRRWFHDPGCSALPRSDIGQERGRTLQLRGADEMIGGFDWPAPAAYPRCGALAQDRVSGEFFSCLLRMGHVDDHHWREQHGDLIRSVSWIGIGQVTMVGGDQGAEE